MRTRINLLPNFNQDHSIRFYIKQFYQISLPVFMIVFLLLLFPYSLETTAPLNDLSKAAFFVNLRATAESLDFDPAFVELKNNFLTNQRIKDAYLRDTFQRAGVSHLLALSGGQTGPAAKTLCLCFLIMIFALPTAYRKLMSVRLVKIIQDTALAFEILIIIFLVGLYQSTGALNRVLSSRISSFVISQARFSGRKSATQELQFYIPRKYILIGPWIIAACLGKNPVHDLSPLAVGRLLLNTIYMTVSLLQHKRH